MRPRPWIRSLTLVAIAAGVVLTTGILPVTPAVAPAAPRGMVLEAMDVPVGPRVVSTPRDEGRAVFTEEFDRPLTDQWTHVSSSTPERTPLIERDGRTAVQVRPEGNLMALSPVPYDVGTTYRATAVLQMPQRSGGVHPSFWLRTNDAAKVGELDVVESWGGDRCGRVHVGFYWQYFPAAGTVSCQGDNYPADLDEWHEYSVEFTYMGPGRDPALHHALPTRFFVDGTETWAAPNSPLAPEYLRLQNKRNCPDEEQPSCGETSTGPSMYVDSVTVEVVGRQPVSTTPDLHLVRDDGSSPVELHTLDATTGLASYRRQQTIPVTPGARYATGDLNGDLVTDLYAVSPAGEGLSAVQVLDGASGFTTTSTQATVGTAALDVTDHALAVGDYNSDGRDDLYAVRTQGDGRTEIQVLDAATGFTTALVAGTTVAPALPERPWQFEVGDYDGDGRDDLYAINRRDRGRTSVHVLDAADGFQSFLSQTYTTAPALDRAAWGLTVADQNNDGRDDLWAVRRDDSGVVSVHVLDAATRFSGYLYESPTVQPAISDDAWKLP